MTKTWYKGAVRVLLLAILATGCFGGPRTEPGWSGIQLADNRVYFASPAGKVYCLEAATGAQVWEFPQDQKEKTGAYYAQPVVVGSVVLAGSVDHNLYALDAQDGHLIWSFPTGGAIFGAVAVQNGTVYVASADHKVYAVNLADGSKLWEFETGNWVWATPVLSEGSLYVASMDHKIYALDAQTGQKQWEKYIGAAIPGTPKLANGMLYFGALDSKVHVLDAATGDEKGAFETRKQLWGRWEVPAGRWFWGQPLIEGQTVYVGSLAGEIYALDAATLEKKWEQPVSLGSAVRAALGYADGQLYAATEKGKLYAIDSETGKSRELFDAKSSILADLVVSEDIIYFSTSSGAVFSVEAKTGSQRWRFPQK